MYAVAAVCDTKWNTGIVEDLSTKTTILENPQKFSEISLLLNYCYIKKLE